jgi:hypothetical protein
MRWDLTVRNGDDEESDDEEDNGDEVMAAIISSLEEESSLIKKLLDDINTRIWSGIDFDWGKDHWSWLIRRAAPSQGISVREGSYSLHSTVGIVIERANQGC